MNLVATVGERSLCHFDLVVGGLRGTLSTVEFDELSDLKLSLESAHIFKTLIWFRDFCHFYFLIDSSFAGHKSQ